MGVTIQSYRCQIGGFYSRINSKNSKKIVKKFERKSFPSKRRNQPYREVWSVVIYVGIMTLLLPVWPQLTINPNSPSAAHNLRPTAAAGLDVYDRASPRPINSMIPGYINDTILGPVVALDRTPTVRRIKAPPLVSGQRSCLGPAAMSGMGMVSRLGSDVLLFDMCE